MYIRDAIIDMRDKKKMSRSEIKEAIGVSSSMITVWLRENSDFTPRLEIARTLYARYGYEIYPYSLEALQNKA